MLIRLLFFWKTTISTSWPQNFVFLLFFWESSVGKFWSSNPNKLLHVRHFAASNQCNRPDLLENTTVKLRSLYERWLVDFDPRPLSVSLRLRSVYLAVILIKGNEKRNRKRQEKGSKYDWTQQTRIKNR